jgi:hypothetical protein
MVQNALETDVDCGGGSCATCVTGKKCLGASDCTSHVCGPTKVCSAPSCTDGTLNGSETDLDCGGSSCPKCIGGKSCVVNTDCLGGLCDSTKHCNAVPVFGLRMPVMLSVGSKPVDIAVGDLDNDGHLDVAVTNQNSDDISLNWGLGNGAFTTGLAVQVSGSGLLTGGTAIGIGDFDGDGRRDIAVGRGGFNGGFGLGYGTATLVSNNGSRTWLPAVDTTSMVQSSAGLSAAVGRFNADARDDIIFGGGNGCCTNDANSWYFPGGVGGFGAGTHFPPPMTTGGGSFVVATDVNLDGKLDMVTHNGVASTVIVQMGDGMGNFAAPQSLSVAGGVGGLRFALIDGDPSPDVVVCSDASNRVGVAFGQGDGSFLAPSSYAAPLAHDVRIADFDGDGKLDLAVAGTGIMMLRGVGDGTFLPVEQWVTSYTLVKIEVGDFDQDGKLDIAALTTSGQALVLLNGP